MKKRIRAIGPVALCDEEGNQKDIIAEYSNIGQRLLNLAIRRDISTCQFCIMKGKVSRRTRKRKLSSGRLLLVVIPGLHTILGAMRDQMVLSREQ